MSRAVLRASDENADLSWARAPGVDSRGRLQFLNLEGVVVTDEMVGMYIGGPSPLQALDNRWHLRWASSSVGHRAVRHTGTPYSKARERILSCRTT